MIQIEETQKELHSIVEAIKNEAIKNNTPEISYQDMFNNAIVVKLNELENRINSIVLSSAITNSLPI